MLRKIKKRIVQRTRNLIKRIIYKTAVIYARLRISKKFYLLARKKKEFFGFIGIDDPLSVPYNSQLREFNEKIRKAADNIKDHRITIFGTEISLGPKIEWNKDFFSGNYWSKKFHGNINFREFKECGDIKVPWELSRFQHFITLASAYSFTHDQSYVEEFQRQASAWIKHNPIGYGVNWVCAMEVALRAINWIRTISYLKNSKDLSEKLFLKISRSLVLHGVYIRNNLEWNSGRTTNHYLADIVGLLYLGLFFSNYSFGKKWRDFAVEQILQEINKQVYSDGMHFEASTSYHRLSLELFLLAGIACEENGIVLPDFYMKKIERMAFFSLHVLKSNGKIPQIGDNDSGRLFLPGNRDVLDHTYLIPMAVMFLKKSELNYIEPSSLPEIRYLFKKEKIGWIENMPLCSRANIRSKAFFNAGVFVMKEGLDFMVISAGPNGQNGNGGHAHNDKLSFELNIDGDDVILDPGTYVYSGNYDMRNLFRSTSYHNTIKVDSQEQNRYKERELFRISDDAHVHIKVWESREELDFLDVWHDGYERLPDPIIHRRQILFMKKKRFWIIKDILDCKEKHDIEINFHFAPLNLFHEGADNDIFIRLLAECSQCIKNQDIKKFPKEWLTLNLNKQRFHLAIIGNVQLTEEIKKGWLSMGYNQKIESPWAAYKARISGNTEIFTVMFTTPSGSI